MAIKSTAYQQMHDQLSQEPTPDPNSFMQWLFTSGILTQHQMDLIRAKMQNPAVQSMMGQEEGGESAPTAPTSPGTPANAVPGTPMQSTPAKPLQPSQGATGGQPPKR